ncbi:MAG: OmpA family protein [Saprospiraceae bacterium]|nr:OmpA family protein [Saprospiraceae bacterium]HRJ13364.1 OmpA family protein [Saprospiraceae bacterium]HRK81838.1 OmpA family protein [Saprospiraceae bacterium]
MTVLLGLLIVVLLAVVVVQIGKVSELATKIRGEEEMQDIVNKRQGFWSLIFMVVFLLAVTVSGIYYKDWYLGFGPHAAASEHGGSIDSLFKWTLFATGFVFIITQILLFVFAYRFSGSRHRKAAFVSHDNKLEMVWTAIPAIVMAFLVIGGLDTWNEVMADIKPGDDYMEIEAVAEQFGWTIRYPGQDNALGERNYKLISGDNPVGQNWKDQKNIDDFHASEIVLPVGKRIRVRVTSKDVLHNFYLPHFRVKMDAVPGMPTYFVFTPKKTTEEYRNELSKYAIYQAPADPADPNGEQLWQRFEYELACAELCGKGHFSMKKIVKIVPEEEYKAWAEKQQSFYFSQVRGTSNDPNSDMWFPQEITERKATFEANLDSARIASSADKKILRFEYVNFETGSAKLTPASQYELGFLVDAMQKYPNMSIEVAGHTDNVGDPAGNQTLSEGRAKSVFDFLVEKGIPASRMRAAGYGDTRPVGDNDTEDGRAKNRRTEFRIITQ